MLERTYGSNLPKKGRQRGFCPSLNTSESRMGTVSEYFRYLLNSQLFFNPTKGLLRVCEQSLISIFISFGVWKGRIEENFQSVTAEPGLKGLDSASCTYFVSFGAWLRRNCIVIVVLNIWTQICDLGLR